MDEPNPSGQPACSHGGMFTHKDGEGDVLLVYIPRVIQLAPHKLLW